MKKVKYEYSIDCPKCGYHLILTNEEEKRCFLQGTLQVRESSPETWTPRSSPPEKGQLCEFMDENYGIIVANYTERLTSDNYKWWKEFTPPLVEDSLGEKIEGMARLIEEWRSKNQFTPEDRERLEEMWRAARERKDSK